MRFLLPTVALSSLLFSCASNGAQSDQPERDLTTLTEAEKVEINQRHMNAMVPCEEHTLLAKLTGKWKQDIQAWMSPDAEPMHLTATSENEMVLGGRFLMTHGTGEFMGFTSETMSMIGFDRRSNEFTIEAYDTMGTYSVGGRGPLGEDGKTAVMRGTDYDAIAQGT